MRKQQLELGLLQNFVKRSVSYYASQQLQIVLLNHTDYYELADFYTQIEAIESWEDSIDDILAAFEKQHRRKLLYSVSFY